MEASLEKKYRRSVQREQILEYLQGRYDHPTAMNIFTGLKSAIPSLSLGNLYRNLGILLEQGRIIKVRDPGSDEDRFDGHVHTHFHFTCGSCQKLFDIDASGFPDLQAAINDRGPWQVDKLDVNLSGLCPECSNLIDKGGKHS
jgi:Fur family peroxide stress response transcriptional regulator